MINAMVDFSGFKITDNKKTVNLCLDSHNCGNLTLTSDCKDGKMTMTWKKDVKGCDGNPQY
jgi:hypothetical protein